MKRLLDWLLGIVGMAIFLGLISHVQANDEWADARRAKDAAEEMKALIGGLNGSE